MNEKNELNDIILNKGGSSSSNKKIMLAVATLGIILIIVVMLMNSITSSGTENLPQAVLPPQPKTVANKATAPEEPLFEEVKVVEEKSSEDNLAKIAQKLKKESLKEEAIVPQGVFKEETPKKKLPQQQLKTKATPKAKVVTDAIAYYVQVGSFSKYEPNKKFLNSIKALGYNYEYYKVTVKSKSINKVLVGPFASTEEAKDARRILRSKVEPGAFLFKLKK